jgi:hypothetical protein
MKRTLFFTGTTLFWLVMTALLIQKHFFQISTVHSPYEVLPLDLEMREEYNVILMGEERIGFNFTVLETQKDNPETPFELRHQTFLSFLFLGHQREMLTRGTAKLDRNLNLREFEVLISSSDQWTRISGQVVKNNLNMVLAASEGEPVRKILPLQGPLFYTEAFRFLWTPENLKVGKKGRLNAWNPLMGNFQTIQFSVFGKTRIDYQGELADVYEIHMDSGGLEVRSWVNQEGVVLKEEGFTGITQIKEEGWQIFDAMRNKKAKLPDLPNLFSIPSNKIIERPELLGALKVKVTTPTEERIMDLVRQDVQGLDDIPFQALDMTELAAYLEASPWVESQDPEIQAKAKEISKNSKSVFEAAIRIMRWVHENVAPVPSLSLPKSKQVLVSKKGDCNEYTVLFTALARAAGVPTRMVAGLVYQNGRFFYHAWAEIYAGRWIAVDPTFGQAPADVTHIPLIEGDLEEQAALVNQIGKLKVEVMETS